MYVNCRNLLGTLKDMQRIFNNSCNENVTTEVENFVRVLEWAIIDVSKLRVTNNTNKANVTTTNHLKYWNIETIKSYK